MHTRPPNSHPEAFLILILIILITHIILIPISIILISIMRDLCRSGCLLSENPRGVERPTAFQCEKLKGYTVHHMCEH